MDKVLGIPAGTLTVVLALLLGIAFATLAVLGARNYVFVKLGMRNVGRRRGRTALIIVGLMLGTTIITTALGTGDTMGATIRSSVYESLGSTDELVTVKGASSSNPMMSGGTTAADYFDESAAAQIAAVAATRPDLVDGVAPAIVEPVAVQDQTARSSEPRVMLFASDPALPDAFGTITASDGSATTLGALGAGEMYLNHDAASALDAHAGDDVLVLAAGQIRPLHVRDVVDFRGTATTSSAMLLGLPAAQDLFGQPGKIGYVLVSNRGGEAGGVALTDEVRALLGPAAASLGLEVNPTKQDLLDIAQQTGDAFMQMFTTFGTFSIVAGIMMIFLIFVMLAAERRGEMGVARAIGTQRGHLVQSFLFEGAAYDVVAAAIGAALGMAISYGMVLAVGRMFAAEDYEIVFRVNPGTFVIAYAIGVLLTMIVVAVSAWRVSRLNVTTAIRNLPDPLVRKRPRASKLRAFVRLAVGVLFTLVGVQSSQALWFLLGVSLMIIGLVPIARLVGISDRVAYTVAGLGLVVWWLLPFSVYEIFVPEIQMDFSVWVVGGLLVVLGATWTVMNNADALLGLAASVLGRIKSLAPVLRISMAYPLRNRVRTAMTLGMFTLVVFTLIVGATTSRSFIYSMNDAHRFGGGFDVRASTSPASPVTDMAAAVDHTQGITPGQVVAVGNQSTVLVKAHQQNAAGDFEDYPLRGLDDTFLDTTTYGFAATAPGYGSGSDVWRAVRDDPHLAVVDGMVAPRRQNWGFGGKPAFALSGFWLDDGVFDPIPVDVRDPLTGQVSTLTIIGVIRSDAPAEWAGIMASSRALAPFGDRAVPTTHFFKLAPGVDPTAFAKQLESAFLGNGMQAESFQSVLDDAVGASMTMNWLILGFMGLGLVVGVAALGVISARSVVERRQQIGVARAVGFQPGMVQLGFLAESAFISLTAIVIGSVLGLVMAWNVVSDAARKPDTASVAFSMPWDVLIVVFVGVFAAALATTWLPARHASHVAAAEALRYQ